MKKTIILTLAMILSVFAIQVGAQTSSSYILGASSRTDIKPFSGFGVNMTPDTCVRYDSVKSDISKIVAVLTSQIDQTVRNYTSASCNTQTTLDANCTKYVDTINNLTLTYATYQIEGLIQSRERARLCDAGNNRVTGVYRNTYYDIDFPAMAYASVRDAYVGKKYTDYATLINTINSNITTKLTKAVAANKFVDISTTSTSLRTLAQATFKSTAVIRAPRQRVVATPPTTTLSAPNMFLLFGLTNNTTDKTITAIPFSSLAEYVSLYNASSTRFGEIYSATNKDLITKGAAILDGVNNRLEQGTPEMQTASLDAYTELVENNIVSTQSQTAYVGGAVGKLWEVISSFLMNVFGVKEVGAQSGSGSNRGSGSGVGVTVTSGPCPAMPNPRLKPTLIFYEKANIRDYPFVASLSQGFPIDEEESIKTGDLWGIFIFKNLYEPNSQVEKVVYGAKTIYSDSLPKLTDDDYSLLLDIFYVIKFPGSITYEDRIVNTKEQNKNKIDDIREKTLKKTFNKTNVSTTGVAELSRPDKPYSCLRAFSPRLDLGAINAGYYDKALVTVTAKGQSASTNVEGSILRKLYRYSMGVIYSESANNRMLVEYGKRNNAK